MIAEPSQRSWTAPATTNLEATVRIELCPGLPAREVDRRIAAAARAGDIGARVLAFYLVDLADRGAHQELGFHNVVQYAHTRFGIQPSTAREYLAAGRALAQLPLIDEAFCAQRLNWSTARLLVRVATPQTEARWVEWATGRTVREIAAQVRLRRAGELPTDPSRRRIHEPSFAVQGRLSLLQYQVWNNARQKLSATTGKAMSDVELMVEAAAAILRAPTENGSQPVNDSHFKVLVHHDAKSGRTAMDTVDGRVELDPQTAGAVLREAGRGDLATKVDRNSGPVLDPEKRHSPTTPEMRAFILGRDGFCCVCCGEKRNLTVHHVWWRRYGGPTEPWNLVTLCEDCHSLVHVRLLVIEGDPPSGLRFADAQGRGLTDLDPSAAALHLRPPPPAEVDARASGMGPDLPDSVDAAWLVRHGQALGWNDRQGTLEFHPDLVGTATFDARASGQVDARASSPRRATLANLVGQRQAVNNLRRAVQAARKRGEPLPHILLCGPPGLGKTSLARAVAAEAGARFHAAAAPVVLEPGVLLRLMASLEEGDVLFLDEIHRLPARVTEALYEAMEDGSLSLPVRCGSRQRTLHVRLSRFSLIGATSQEELLPVPLLGRFQLREHLEFYGADEIARILMRAAAGMKVGLARDAAAKLAEASRGTPREALAILRSARDEAATSECSSIDLPLAAHTLTSLGIDELGLRTRERRYIDVLRSASEPVGLTTLAGRLGESRETVQRVYEPYLLRRGLVFVTPFGRALAARLVR